MVSFLSGQDEPSPALAMMGFPRSARHLARLGLAACCVPHFINSALFPCNKSFINKLVNVLSTIKTTGVGILL